MGLIQKFTDVVANTGVKHYPDRSINSGTKAVFDVGAGGVFGGAKNVASGDSIYSLTFSDSSATFSKPHTYENGGMAFTGVAGDQFNLPAVASPHAADKHWLVTMWLKIANYGVGTVGVNNQTFSFSTSNINDSTASTLGMTVTAVAGSSPSSIAVYVRGKFYTIKLPATPLFDGGVHQFALECEVSADNTQQRVFIYLDQIQVYASGWAAVAATIPTDPTYRYVGTSPAFPKAWSGIFYRYRKDDLTTTSKSTAQILADDLDVASGRFS